MIVCKFGGSSLADAKQFRKVKAIMDGDPQRKYIVPSAPGKRDAQDIKITDLLYACYDAAQAGRDPGEFLAQISIRYQEIADALGLKLDLKKEFALIRENLLANASRDYAASRGEYLNGKLMAEYLGFPFVDAKDVIEFTPDGKLMDAQTDEKLRSALAKHSRAVIPGFYGADEQGKIHTFSRGGSDITGALVARAVNADVYENWTDVTGIRMTDPRIVPDARFIATMTYRELRELSYMGFSVLHDEAVFPVRRSGIPTNIRNTNDPLHPGTMICAAVPGHNPHVVTGIAGMKGFTTVNIEKDLMSGEASFGRKVLQAFEESGIRFENMPTGVDSMSVVVPQKDLAPHKEEVLQRITELVHPDQITVHERLALIATVGRGMVRNKGTAARLFTAISAQGISIRTIDQGASELNIIVGVDEDDFETAVRAIYDAFERM